MAKLLVDGDKDKDLVEIHARKVGSAQLCFLLFQKYNGEVHFFQTK